MAEMSFDVVISDMRMPAMSSAELLNEVMKRHPKTVRIILSGYADREVILRCVGSTHQYLAKPCDAKTLRMTLQRAMQLEQSLKSDNLRQLVTRCTELPSVPALYSEIIEAMQDPSVDVEGIGALVMKDVAITAKILKLANSAFFGLGHEISSPGDAISYLGTDTIKSLILFIRFNTHCTGQSRPGSRAFPWTCYGPHSLEIGKRLAKAVAFAGSADRKLVG